QRLALRIQRESFQAAAADVDRECEWSGASGWSHGRRLGHASFYDHCMILSPRYEGPTILTIDGHPSDQLQPLTRQRRRMQAMLTEISEQEWTMPSRCAG